MSRKFGYDIHGIYFKPVKHHIINDKLRVLVDGLRIKDVESSYIVNANNKKIGNIELTNYKTYNTQGYFVVPTEPYRFLINIKQDDNTLHTFTSELYKPRKKFLGLF